MDNTRQKNELLNWSYVLTLVGAALIIAGGVVGAIMMSVWTWNGSPMMGAMGMMGYYGAGTWPSWMPTWVAVWSVAIGAVLAFAAGRINAAQSAAAWGVVVIVAGALSFFAMGGFMLGGLAAIIGGSLAVVASARRAGA